tara:strand:+ start:32719 stop:33684 length:966 start_codon:yes stop_codon:yes gene_type:complete
MQKIKQNISKIIKHCGCLNELDNVLIIYDSSTKKISELFFNQIKKSNKVQKTKIKLSDHHGFEPSKKVAILMKNSKLIICLSKYSLAHSMARLNASKNGSRFLSMPFYNFKLLRSKSFDENFKKQFFKVRNFTNILSNSKELLIISQKGTKVKLFTNKRKGNCCPGFVSKPGELGSPPDIESNISPLEKKSEGIAVIDGSITHEKLGLLKTPVYFDIKKGFIKKIYSKNKRYQIFLNQIFGDKKSKKRILAECGIGFNRKAKITGHMLTDEGSYGCVHFGFGANNTVGGKNKVGFHLDCIIKKPTLFVDKKKIIDEGKILI